MIRFGSPEQLWLLLALPLLILLGLLVRRNRLVALRQFSGGAAWLTRFRAEVSPHRRTVKSLLWIVVLTASILAVARPQWGTRVESVERRGSDVFMVLDTSLSMAAEDLPPNRLSQAKRKIERLLGALPGERVGLVTFAGEATIACPLTLDHGAIRLFLDPIDVEAVTVPGTAMAQALSLALESFGDVEDDFSRSRAVVLLTDGEDHEGELSAVLDEYVERGVRIYAIGIGTSRGAPIPLRDEDGNGMGYKTDRENHIVTTRLVEETLEGLAFDTGGSYLRATVSGVEIDEVLSGLANLDDSEFGAVLRSRYEERFQYPLAVAIAALIGNLLLPERRSAGRRERKETA